MPENEVEGCIKKIREKTKSLVYDKETKINISKDNLTK